MSDYDHLLLVIVGPTAVGKTHLAISCAERWSTEIISADSRQLFRELTIGTAKPAASELKRVTHHFVNHRSIRDSYTADDFGQEARACLTELFAQHNLVVVCGGSGLYLRALLEGLDDIPDVAPEVRDDIRKEYEVHGLPWLQGRLRDLDPEQLSMMDDRNPQRLMRALEVRIGTGRSIREFQTRSTSRLSYPVVKVGLQPEREQLYERINDRVDEMVKAGLEDEARRLYPDRHYNALQTVGYQEMFEYFEGRVTRDDAIAMIKQNTRNYARRQLTWFRRDKEITWFDPGDEGAIFQFIESRRSRIEK